MPTSASDFQPRHISDDAPPHHTLPNAFDRARRRWDQLQDRHWHLLRGERPSPLRGEPLRQLTATFLDPNTAPLLRELVRGVLADDGDVGAAKEGGAA
jgi:hypothetical protein